MGLLMRSTRECSSLKLISFVVLILSCCVTVSTCKAQTLGYVGDIVILQNSPYVRVNQVVVGSPAHLMQLRVGDLIARINGFVPLNQETVRRATLAGNGEVVLDVVRSGQLIRLRGWLRNHQIVLPAPPTSESGIRGAITGDNFREAAARVNRGQNLAILRKLGIRVQPYTSGSITRLAITDIDVNGLAYKYGLRAR